MINRPGKSCKYPVALIISALIIWNMCSSKQSPNSPDDDITYIETAAMAALSDSLIFAFQSENKDSVLALVSPEYRAVSEEELDGTLNTMAAVSRALEKRKLVYASGLYAEYEIIIGEEKYSVAYGNCGNDHWQLIRF
ncbi:hypothetical protein JW948_14660 [bacterium]|nr:hypothetical protein [bacterium]